MNWLKDKGFYLIILFLVVSFFFKPILSGKIPFPADTLLGLYHPWRDIVWNNLTAGVPFKNPLITDPVRQQYPYRQLAISLVKQGKLPVWNPYSFAGTPLFANPQTAFWYPLNILFILLPFSYAWTMQIFLQMFLGGIFLYAYLRYFKLHPLACIFGSIAFMFSGFSIAWFTWNTVGQTLLWLPLILLAKEKLTDRFALRWALVLTIAESSMIFAGHPQTVLYIVIFATIYLLIRIVQKLRRQKNHDINAVFKATIPFIATAAIVGLVTSMQIIPFIQFLTVSARNFDLPDWHRPDWFLPFQHLVQFIAPDYFGSPVTGNYWGIWNYGEFVSYIGLVPLLFALYAIVFRRDTKTLFFTIAAVVCLLFALPTPLAQFPYRFGIPFISTMQPSRIVVLVDFALVILAAFGIDHILHTKKALCRPLILIQAMIGLVLLVWMSLLFTKIRGVSDIVSDNLVVSKRNLILPIALFFLATPFIILLTRSNKWRKIGVCILLCITIFDLLRFGNKFTPFVQTSWIYPSTKTIEFLQNNLGFYRFMTTDRRLFPPNVSTYYHLQSVDGYDPLYLQNYGELVAAWTRSSPDISPASFNRILIPENYGSFITDLMGVKYILSLKDEQSSKLKLVFQEGETRVYENIAVYPRAFLVEKIEVATDKKNVMNKLFENQKNLLTTAIVMNPLDIVEMPLSKEEYATITQYSENTISIHTNTSIDRLLIITDIQYPTWQAIIDATETIILPVDYALRGVIVPKGEHTVIFRVSLW